MLLSDGLAIVLSLSVPLSGLSSDLLIDWVPEPSLLGLSFDEISGVDVVGVGVINSYDLMVTSFSGSEDVEWFVDSEAPQFVELSGLPSISLFVVVANGPLGGLVAISLDMDIITSFFLLPGCANPGLVINPELFSFWSVLETIVGLSSVLLLQYRIWVEG